MNRPATIKFPASYIQIEQDEFMYICGGDLADTMETLTKVGKVITYTAKLLACISSIINSINTFYKTSVTLYDYVQENF